MALDFYRRDTQEYLFGLGDQQFHNLQEIFKEFQYRTGLIIDQYGDTVLSIENQQTLIKIIDGFIEKTDLNKDKAKTVSIIEFRGLLNYFITNRVDLQLKGD
ncbi:hypothetical protein [Desertivirga arenae]|uniref:hypothetical protein n=1 Tax=Desertivirga arenae TaxID=2810309 RepID=UPI001A963541|nr:hypothetical protein [Pedobacter sp. SYSU D00823]